MASGCLTPVSNTADVNPRSVAQTSNSFKMMEAYPFPLCCGRVYIRFISTESTSKGLKAPHPTGISSA